ncbi:MAG: YebC/PmpR family DNA-binding transcriptional regulator [Gammaproteobacteria bacterium]
MAGHSKWANIRHRKGQQDARRGKLLTKLLREITAAARAGGDISANPRLRAAVDSALSNNMTKDTVERAIARGTSGAEGQALEEVRYEGYGPGGTAVMVECLTDNRNRTVAEVRHAFSKAGGNLGTDGSVAYLFSKCGLLSYPVGADPDAIMEAALEAGAEDVVTQEEGSVEVITAPEDFNRVKDGMIAMRNEPQTAELTMRASTTNPLSVEQAEKMMKLLDTLEDLDDVQRVYSNAEISEEILARIA